MSAMASKKLGPGPGTKVGTALQVEAPAPRSGNVLKKPHIQHGGRPIPSSDREKSQGLYTQHVEFVVITDTESELSEDNKH